MEGYVELLDKNYDECCAYLLNKYGNAADDYFSESSYERFKKGEIKSLGKRKITRTAEGLYIHHMDEDKQIMISSQKVIKMFDIPFDYQKRERLVYCNLIEHAILHLLIAKKDVEESKKGHELQAHGIGGYINFIRPQLVQWLVEEDTPKDDWQINCLNAIAMPVDDAEVLIEHMDAFLLTNYPISQEEIDNGTVKWLENTASD